MLSKYGAISVNQCLISLFRVGAGGGGDFGGVDLIKLLGQTTFLVNVSNTRDPSDRPVVLTFERRNGCRGNTFERGSLQPITIC